MGATILGGFSIFGYFIYHIKPHVEQWIFVTFYREEQTIDSLTKLEPVKKLIDRKDLN
jgi:hypothetical protein